METGKLNIVVDGQWGSCGKGLIAGFLGNRWEIGIASTNNLPNAGHTIVVGGTSFISKILPVNMFLNKFGRNIKAYIGPGAGFRIGQLLKEMNECDIEPSKVRIHPRTMVVTDEHAAIERGEKSVKQSTKHIASTMQGSGAVQVERLMRGPTVKLARDIPEISEMIVDDWFEEIHSLLDNNRMWLHEGSQGFSLGMLHGSHYPFCLSYQSKVLLDDNTTMAIGKIVNNKLDVKVKCLDNDGHIVSGKIVNWHKSDLLDRKWYNIITETSVYAPHDKSWYGPKLTGNHQVKTTNGLKRVDELVSGDEIYTLEHKITGGALQVFLGSMLGDGTVCNVFKSPKRAQFSFSHCEKQQNYCRDKAAIMESYTAGGMRNIITSKSSFKEGNNHIRYESAYRNNIKKLAKRYGCFGVKRPNINAIIKDIEWAGIAIWYQDDGQYKLACNGQEIFMHSQGFTKEENQQLADCLNSKFNLNFSVNKRPKRYNNEKLEGQYEYYLRLSRTCHDKFFENIKFYISPCMKYKMPDKYDISWSLASDNLISDIETIVDVVEVKKKFRHNNVTYNIEIKDCHNYFVSNHAGYFNVENCTSRECTVSRELMDMGLAPSVVGDVYVVVRPYPIRVGNVVENGKIVGYSGDVYDDQAEMSWADIRKLSGYPSDYDLQEITTVTKRVRRVFTFSMEQVKRACRVNGATKIALNFANYLDYECFQTGGYLYNLDLLPRKVRDFIVDLETAIGIPVALVGTGPGIGHVWYKD